LPSSPPLSPLGCLLLGTPDVPHVGHPTRPPAGQGAVHMAQLAQAAWINLPGGSTSALQNRFRNLSLNAGFIPRRNQTVPDSWTVMLLVGVGMGASWTLSSVASSVRADDVKLLS